MSVYLGTNIKNYMRSMGISFRQLASASNIAVSTVIRMHDMGDNPEYKANSSSLNAVAAVIGVTPAALRYEDIYKGGSCTPNIPKFNIELMASLPAPATFLSIFPSDALVRICLKDNTLEEMYHELESNRSEATTSQSIVRVNSTQHGFRIIGQEMYPALSKGDVVVFQSFESVEQLPTDAMVVAIVEPRAGMQVAVVRRLALTDYGEVTLVKNELDPEPIYPARIIGLVVGRYTEFHTS